MFTTWTLPGSSARATTVAEDTVRPTSTRSVPGSGRIRFFETTVRGVTVNPGVYVCPMLGRRRIYVERGVPLLESPHPLLRLPGKLQRSPAPVEHQAHDASAYTLLHRNAPARPDVYGPRRRHRHGRFFPDRERKQPEVAERQRSLYSGRGPRGRSSRTHHRISSTREGDGVIGAALPPDALPDRRNARP